MHKLVQEAITFDDVLIVPRKIKENNLKTDLKTKLTKKLYINSPLVSSPMDTVTEARVAIYMARYGGIGIIHRNMSIEAQVAEVEKVKRSEFGIIKNPFSLGPNAYLYEAEDLMKKYRVSGLPITEYDKLIGIITNRDLRFETDYSKKIYEVMTRENLVTAKEGTSLSEAKAILDKHKIEKLPIIDENGDLKGLITTKDIMKAIQYPNSARDSTGCLLVGAAVGITDNYMDRVSLLAEKLVDVIVIDTPHGHSEKVANVIYEIKTKYPNIEVIAGNVATEEATKYLIDSGADAIRVGIGPGSVCTTGIASGVGMPQITAIYNCANVASKFGVPIIADGGIKVIGDVTKAIIAGANSVMMGYMFAGCEESPGEIEIFQGRKYKKYRSFHLNRENQINNIGLMLPDGVEGRIEYKGSIKEVLKNILRGIKDSMYYCGSFTIDDLIKNGEFVKITTAGYRESLPHSIEVTKEAQYK
ncbi:MAG: IMP dehydrogenase [Defluviitaleaceae bacterium]|nr:IMP dehydrogenase [Defluviitaleaceae bacterium]